MFSFSSVWLFLEDETELFNFPFSGNDQLLRSRQEGERLHQLLPNSELRKFDDCGHFLFLVLFSPFLFFFRHAFSRVSIQECIVIILGTLQEDSIDLVTVIKGTSYYRRGNYHDYASDFIPPTPGEAKKVIESYR